MLLNLDSVPPFYKNYVKQVEETDLIQALRISGHRSLELLHTIPDTKKITGMPKENGQYAKYYVTW